MLKEERAGYGEQIIKGVAKELNSVYGKGFDTRGLFRMVKLAKLTRKK